MSVITYQGNEGKKQLIETYGLSSVSFKVQFFAINSSFILANCSYVQAQQLADDLKWDMKVYKAEEISKEKSTISLTFGEVAENHIGNEQVGEISPRGYSVDEIKQLHTSLKDKGIPSVIHMLPVPDNIDPDNFEEDLEACILVIPNGINNLLADPNATEKLFVEQARLKKDKKALMRGAVKNKNARWNLCFDDNGHEAEYEKGIGTVIEFDKVPLLKKLREAIDKHLNPPVKNLKAEGNYYYDIKQTYINYHGDTERRIVIAARLGHSFPIFYQWYYDRKPVGERFKITLNGGDIYVMSQKAVGTDWKRWKIPTLRHAAGFEGTKGFFIKK